MVQLLSKNTNTQRIFTKTFTNQTDGLNVKVNFQSDFVLFSFGFLLILLVVLLLLDFVAVLSTPYHLFMNFSIICVPKILHLYTHCTIPYTHTIDAHTHTSATTIDKHVHKQRERDRDDLTAAATFSLSF